MHVPFCMSCGQKAAQPKVKKGRTPPKPPQHLPLLPPRPKAAPRPATKNNKDTNQASQPFSHKKSRPVLSFFFLLLAVAFIFLLLKEAFVGVD
jgi:hypothetical protein